MATQPPSHKPRKKGPKLTKDGKITVFDSEDTNYGIRELIDLIRYIPDGQDVFFGAEMIKKTLNSMQLSIHDIMQDGVEKRKLAAKTIQHLVAEISDYQRRIQSLKGHIRHLRFELGEIQDTCHYLLADDSELIQYQHILDEVPKSPIEGFEADEEPIEAVKELELTAAEDDNSKPLLNEETPAPASKSHFKHVETLVDALDDEDTDTLATDSPAEPLEDFLPDAFKNPDDDYIGKGESAILSDDVFDPDRFDDENGLSHKKSKSKKNLEPTSFKMEEADDHQHENVPILEVHSEADSDANFSTVDDADFARRL